MAKKTKDCKLKIMECELMVDKLMLNFNWIKSNKITQKQFVKLTDFIINNK